MHLIHVALPQGAFAPGSAQGGPAGGQLGGQQPGGGGSYLGGMTLIPSVSLAMQPGAGGSYAIQAATLAQQQQMQLAMVAQQRALAAQQAAVKQQKAAAAAVRTPPVPGVGNPAQGPAGGQRAERDLKAVVWQRREEVRSQATRTRSGRTGSARLCHATLAGLALSRAALRTGGIGAAVAPRDCGGSRCRMRGGGG